MIFSLLITLFSLRYASAAMLYAYFLLRAAVRLYADAP